MTELHKAQFKQARMSPLSVCCFQLSICYLRLSVHIFGLGFHLANLLLMVSFGHLCYSFEGDEAKADRYLTQPKPQLSLPNGAHVFIIWQSGRALSQ